MTATTTTTVTTAMGETVFHCTVVDASLCPLEYCTLRVSPQTFSFTVTGCAASSSSSSAAAASSSSQSGERRNYETAIAYTRSVELVTHMVLLHGRSTTKAASAERRLKKTQKKRNETGGTANEDEGHESDESDVLSMNDGEGEEDNAQGAFYFDPVTGEARPLQRKSTALSSSSSSSSLGGYPLIIATQPANEIDIVLLMDNATDRQEVVRTLVQMLQQRNRNHYSNDSAAASSVPAAAAVTTSSSSSPVKFIVYDYSDSERATLENFAMGDIDTPSQDAQQLSSSSSQQRSSSSRARSSPSPSATAGASPTIYVKWRAELASHLSTVPFPHTRLDFLALHLNKSVMARLTRYGDRRLELSVDSAQVFGIGPFAEHFFPQPRQQQEASPSATQAEQQGRGGHVLVTSTSYRDTADFVMKKIVSLVKSSSSSSSSSLAHSHTRPQIRTSGTTQSGGGSDASKLEELLRDSLSSPSTAASTTLTGLLNFAASDDGQTTGAGDDDGAKEEAAAAAAGDRNASAAAAVVARNIDRVLRQQRVKEQYTDALLPSDSSSSTVQATTAIATTTTHNPFPTHHRRVLDSFLSQHFFVIILADTALYVTERTGRVIARVPVEDVVGFVVLRSEVVPGAASGSSGVAIQQQQQQQSSSVAQQPQQQAAVEGIVVFFRRKQAASETQGKKIAVDYLVIRNRYAMDMAHRLSLLSVAASTMAAANAASASIVASENKPQNKKKREGKDEASETGRQQPQQQQHELGKGCSTSKPSSPSSARPKITSAWTQTPIPSLSLQAMEEGEESRGLMRSPQGRRQQQENTSAPNAPAYAAETYEAELLALRGRLDDANNTTRHRDMTIRLLQQRCSQLSTTTTAAAAAAATTSATPKSLPRSGPTTPRKTTTTTTTPSQQQRRLHGQQRGASSNKTPPTTPRGGRAASAAPSIVRHVDDQAAASGTAVVDELESTKAALETLRHYTVMLEQQIKTQEDQEKLRQRVEQLERELGFFTSLERRAKKEEEQDEGGESLLFKAIEEAKAKYRCTQALAEVKCRQERLEGELESHRQQAQHMHEATNAVISELAVKAQTSVQEYVESYFAQEQQEKQQRMTYKNDGGAGGNGYDDDDDESQQRHPLRAWEQLLDTADELEVRVQQEVSVRHATSAAMNATLIEELRMREKQLDALTSQLEQHPSAEQQQQQPQKKDFDLVRMNRQVSQNLHDVQELESRKGVLEAKNRSLQRQTEDLKRGREALIEEGNRVVADVYASCGLDVGASRNSKQHPAQAAKTRIEVLRHQVLALERLQHVPLLINKVAALEYNVRQAEGHKETAVASSAELEKHQQRFAAVKRERDEYLREMGALQQRCAESDGEVMKLTDALELQTNEFEKLRTENESEVRELKKQVKYHKERISELIHAQKRHAVAVSLAQQQQQQQQHLAAGDPTFVAAAHHYPEAAGGTGSSMASFSGTASEAGGEVPAAQQVQQHKESLDNRQRREKGFSLYGNNNKHQQSQSYQSQRPATTQALQTLQSVHRDHPEWSWANSNSNSNIAVAGNDVGSVSPLPNIPGAGPATAAAVTAAYAADEDLRTQNAQLREQLASQRKAHESQFNDAIETFRHYDDYEEQQQQQQPQQQQPHASSFDRDEAAAAAAASDDEETTEMTMKGVVDLDGAHDASQQQQQNEQISDWVRSTDELQRHINELQDKQRRLENERERMAAEDEVARLSAEALLDSHANSGVLSKQETTRHAHASKQHHHLAPPHVPPIALGKMTKSAATPTTTPRRSATRDNRISMSADRSGENNCSHNVSSSQRHHDKYSAGVAGRFMNTQLTPRGGGGAGTVELSSTAARPRNPNYRGPSSSSAAAAALGTGRSASRSEQGAANRATSKSGSRSPSLPQQHQSSMPSSANNEMPSYHALSEARQRLHQLKNRIQDV